MLDALITILDEYKNQGLEYRLIERKKSRAESFYIKKSLEMNRGVDTDAIALTVYKVFEEDGKSFRGSADATIHPGMTREEIKNVIDEAFFAAGFVKNEMYPLEEKGAAPTGEFTSGIPALGVHKTMSKLREAVYAQDKHDKGNISYSEFFVDQSGIRIINSNGVDVRYTAYSVDIELSVHWRDGGEVENFEAYKLADCDTALIGGRVEKLFNIASQKPLAVPTPSVNDVNVLLTGECLNEFFNYYYENSNASSIYTKISTFAVGDELQGECAGDRFTLELDPFLPGSTGSRPYDNNGTPLKKVCVVKDGRLMQLWGDLRFSSYLNAPVTGNIENRVITGGSTPVSEMKTAPYLELISFSDFQMNSMTGDFAGEIRFGFYYDGTETVPVTGGSVSGNIKKVHGDMLLSAERARYNNYDGPATVLVKNVSIAGK